jgi:phage terminase small subunit
MAGNMALTAKQTSFIQYYADPGSESYNNGTQSAIKAGYSKKTANPAAARLLANVNIIEGLRQYRAKKAVKFELEAGKVLARLSKIAGLTPVSADDELFPRTTADQIRGLDLLGKHLKLWDRTMEAPKDNTHALDPAEAKELDSIGHEFKLRISKGLQKGTG